MTDSFESPSRWPLALGALVVGIALGSAGVWFATQNQTDSSAVAETTNQTTLIEAQSRDLISIEEWAGTLQAGSNASVSASTGGTVTRIAAVGDSIELGGLLAEIDGNPVVALYGTVPQFREIDIESDPGADIRQLEENLVALGFDQGGTVLVDEVFTAETEAMVERWEVALGIDLADGKVDAGQIAFIEGPSEVLDRTSVGNQVNPGQPLLTTLTLATSGFVPFVDETDVEAVSDATDAIPVDAELVDLDTGDDTPAVGRPIQRWESSEISVELAVDVAEVDTFEIGRTVGVELPDGQIVNAEVVEVSNVARTNQNTGETVVDVSIRPTEPIESLFTTGPIVVQIEQGSTLGAVVVPARSLIALAEGGHAIEIDGRGLVGVELGSFDDGWVEVISGDVDAGEAIVVAA